MYEYLLLSGELSRIKMCSKNITLKVKAELYNEYREHCKKEGLIVSRQFEKLMEKHLKESKNE